MPIVIETKTIKPAKMRIDEVRLELLNELRRQGKAILEQYERTTQTWRNKPKFEQQISLKGGEATILIGTDDKIYKYVDEGTKVRHAVMSRDWVSKTTPGLIGSGAGRGRVVFISKKINLPGIKARKFTEIIQARMKDKFRDAMLKATRVGADKAQAKAT